MLQANKAALLTDLHLESVNVQFLEVEYFLLVFGKVTNLASLLAGFAAAALMQTASQHQQHHQQQQQLGKQQQTTTAAALGTAAAMPTAAIARVAAAAAAAAEDDASVYVCCVHAGTDPSSSKLHFLHILATGGALGFMLLVLLTATLCSIWGPGLALRGSGHNSVSKAVEVMDKAQQTALRFFKVGLWCYLFSTALSVCLWQPLLDRAVLLLILLWAARQLHATDFEFNTCCSVRGLTRGEIRSDPLSKAPESSSSCAYSCFATAETFQGMQQQQQQKHAGLSSASSTAETLHAQFKKPQGAAYTPGWSHEDAHATSELPVHADDAAYGLYPSSTQQQQQQQQQEEEWQQEAEEEGNMTFRRMASSLYTSAIENLASFVGFSGEEVS
ncbi:hypothetical protein Efla_000913 [Eimeria flavescens]